MKNFWSITIFISLIFSNYSLKSQAYPRNYFRSPLDIPLVLSGTFGELRGGHFHSGIDIKTQGRTGLNVYASAGGYISRISVSPWGYGNALYIKHPNGYTTVYAHLDRFNKTLDSLTKKIQYQRKSFKVNYYPKPGLLKVKKGEIIAYSGNSGSSGGPHLHFEIRDSGEHPLNPFLFGIKVRDNIKPTIKELKIYNLTDYNHPVTWQFSINGKKNNLGKNDTIKVWKDFYIGIYSYDRLNGANNKNGIYSYSVSVDSTEIFRSTASRLSFSEKRYINAYIDYASYYNDKKKFQQTIILPGNKLSLYKNVKNSVVISVKDTAVHRITVKTMDFAGNSRTVQFFVKKGQIPVPRIFYPPPNFKYNEYNTYKTDDAKIEIPAGSFYQDVYFGMSSTKNKYTPYSKLIVAGDPHIPLHNYVTLSVKADSLLTKKLYGKAALASLSKDRKIIYEGGSYSNGYVKCKTRSLGSYFIVVDTVAPVIKAVNVYNGKNIRGQKSIDFTVTDNLSGVKKYNGYVNGQWVLGKYDPKRNRISFDIDEHYPKGDFEFKFVAVDDKGNEREVRMRLR